jgi:hypothetical protein
MQVRILLGSETPTRWATAFSLARVSCNVNISIRSVEELVIANHAPPFPRCQKITPGAIEDVLIVPPLFEHVESIPLVANLGSDVGEPLSPGVYSVEAVLSLARVPGGGDDFLPPLLPAPQVTVSIEIRE